ncbi:hypothetical protein [Oceanicaulis sp.]|uniref:hypothetical protein n=1 Tax=Oceanicaulis sp. TaxID=1924941 RepID=UPI003F6EEF35
MHFKNASSLEEALAPGERMLWVDRSSPTRPRYVPVSWMEMIPVEFKFFTVSLVGVFIGASVMFFAEDFLQHFIGFCLLVVSGTGSGFLLRWIIHKKRRGEPVLLDYMLTPSRLVALQPKSSIYEEVELERIVSLIRDGRSLILRAVNPKDEFHFFDLADADAAEAIIAKTLGPLS